MEKNPKIENLVTIDLVSRPQESYNYASLKSSSRRKNMGLTIAQALILTIVLKRLFIWPSLSKNLFAITASRTLLIMKRGT
jgi:hypothetical protein